MTRPVLTMLAATSTLVALLAAAPARADHDDGWRRPGPGFSASISVYPEPPPPAATYPAPGYLAPAPAPYSSVVVAPWRPARWGGGWRGRELRHAYFELDAARARFYATWDGRPWTRARFESWYASRHAALDARWAELGRWSR